MAPIEEKNPEIRIVLLAVQQKMRAAASGRGRGSMSMRDIDYGEGHFNVKRWPKPVLWEYMDSSEMASCGVV